MIKTFLDENAQKWVWPVKNIFHCVFQKQIEWTDFLHGGANSGMNFGWARSKMGRLFSSWDHNICCILRMSLWIELIFWYWLWCNNFWLEQHHTLYIFDFHCQSTAVLLAGHLAVAGRVLWNRACPSFCLVVCPGVFLELDHWVSLNFGMVLETLLSCAWQSQIFWKNFFCSKYWENGPTFTTKSNFVLPQVNEISLMANNFH